MMTRWFGGGGWAIYNTLVGISWGIFRVFLVVFLGVFLEDDDDDSVVWWLGVGNLQHFSRGRRGPEADIRGAAFFYRNTWHGNSWTWSYGNDTKGN